VLFSFVPVLTSGYLFVEDGNVSKPQQLGYQVARPRDGAAPGFAFLTNPFYTGEYEEDRKAGAQPKVVEAVAHVFGTGTDNFVDDFDILLLGSSANSSVLFKSTAWLIPCLIPEKGERPDELSQFYNKSGVDSLPDLQIKVRDQIFNVHKSILYCRSDYFRKEFESLPDKATSLSTLEITDSDSSLFGSMLELLYTDLVNVAAVGDKFREFAALLRKYAPNHVQRAVEHHLMTKVTTASTMAKDMKTLAHQQLFSDIVFKVGNEPVYAHKVCRQLIALFEITVHSPTTITNIGSFVLSKPLLCCNAPGWAPRGLPKGDSTSRGRQ
jgi:hypothetical protein